MRRQQTQSGLRRLVLAGAAAVVFTVVSACGTNEPDGNGVGYGLSDQPGTFDPSDIIDRVGTSPVTFDEIAASAGITQRRSTYRLPPDCLFSELTNYPTDGCSTERLSGGVTVGDINNNGLDDLFVTSLDGPDALYLNNGDGTFTDITEDAGLAEFSTHSNGAGFADLDNNGFQDLFVTTVAEDRYYLFINNGDGTFTEQAVERGVAMTDGRWRSGFSVAFGDYDNDGHIDIHLTEWYHPDAHPLAEPPFPKVPNHARLLRNNGDGTFADVTGPAGVELGLDATRLLGVNDDVQPMFSFSSAFVDLDGDGFEDLVVAADFGITQLFWNNGDGTFTEGTGEAGIGTEGNAMGLAIGDVNGDGLPDIFISAITDRSAACDGRPCEAGMDGNRLYINNGDRTFTETQNEAGVLDGGWGWGAAMFDMDNDGHLDLVLANGADFTLDEEYSRLYRAHLTEQPRLWHNRGDGTFTEVAASAGLQVTKPGLGLVTIDIEGNGYLDVVMVHPDSTPTVWRNNGGTNNAWLQVAVNGAGPLNGGTNRDGRGAIVDVTPQAGGPTQTRIVGVNSHFLGHSALAPHFGLGDPDTLAGGTIHEVTVTFPASGRSVVVRDVDPNQRLVVTEPDS